MKFLFFVALALASVMALPQLNIREKETVTPVYNKDGSIQKPGVKFIAEDYETPNSYWDEPKN
ncbi:hypothetical protein MP228_001273 [Amoeboaphelidium protococcarum]|nr:hypothetical protein MP228_001273 [Amoeboaphelidium protococcarum]